MSRIGKKEIHIPLETIVTFNNNNISVEGKFGLLNQPILDGIILIRDSQKLFVTCANGIKKYDVFRGLMRALIQNMILGVNTKFVKTLLAEGVGYKFQIVDNLLKLNMGYSHSIKISIPENIDIKLESLTKLIISGISKEQVGLFASRIRNIRPPEPYNGKGIRYDNEKIIKKIGKTGK